MRIEMDAHTVRPLRPFAATAKSHKIETGTTYKYRMVSFSFRFGISTENTPVPLFDELIWPSQSIHDD